MLTAMLGGFANQQLARNLARSTVEGRENTVKAFAAYVNAFPWQWTSAMVDEWLGDLRSLRDLKRSTIRSYSEAVRSFCHFATDPLYEWASACEERFGSHPVHVVHEAKTVRDARSSGTLLRGSLLDADLAGAFDRIDGGFPMIVDTGCHAAVASLLVDRCS
ncbi:hypothetical protein ACFRFL_09325 [Streptomyces sp. NPDC056708]|uniref:hypothetical protein n=1 Tax=unclassified Streptomyces TaxID=2593676 RepID=UPI00369C2836